MKYFLDAEFNGFGGALISMALVREDGASLYLVYEPPGALDPWVDAHVMPSLESVPPEVEVQRVGQAEGARAIWRFLGDDPAPDIIADWPDDVRCFCQAILITPRTMPPFERLRFDVRRTDTSFVRLPGAVRHNAWWDAMALRRQLTGL